MSWIREHPYASALGAAGLLIIIGVVVVETHSPVTPVSQPSAWGGVNGIPTNPAYTPGAAPDTQAVPETLGEGTASTSIPVFTYPQTSDGTSDNSPGASGSSFNFDALIALMSQQTQATSSASASGTGGLINAYTFIPQGLISTTTSSIKKETPAQGALYDYGNEAGSDIQSFEGTHADISQVLTNQVNDRTDPQKAAAVESIGNGLIVTGKKLENITDAPSSVASLNLALAKSYEDIGAKLELVPQTQTDQQFLAAVEAYDSAADTFTKNYVALASYFAAFGVTFSSSDPGSVFSFTDASL